MAEGAGPVHDALVEKSPAASAAPTPKAELDRRAHDAVRAAAAFIRDERASFPGGAAPSSPDQIAVLALKVYELFLDGRGRTPAATAAAIVEASRR